MHSRELLFEVVAGSRFEFMSLLLFWKRFREAFSKFDNFSENIYPREYTCVCVFILLDFHLLEQEAGIAVKDRQCLLYSQLYSVL